MEEVIERSHGLRVRPGTTQMICEGCGGYPTTVWTTGHGVQFAELATCSKARCQPPLDVFHVFGRIVK